MSLRYYSGRPAGRTDGRSGGEVVIVLKLLTGIELGNKQEVKSGTDDIREFLIFDNDTEPWETLKNHKNLKWSSHARSSPRLSLRI